MSIRHTATWVHGVSQCAKNQNRTCTHSTHFGNTTGLPIPVLNPRQLIKHEQLDYEMNDLHKSNRLQLKLVQMAHKILLS